jgi:glycosyltransferase involved in cell wall biosynthesis
MHVCEKVQPWRCSLCVGGPRLISARKWLWSTIKGRTDETRNEGRLTRVLRFPPRLARYLAEESFHIPIVRRMDSMRNALLAADRLLAPSQFLLERFVEQGIPRERLEFSEYGMDDAPFRAAPPRAARASGEPVRFGFVGTLMPSKGPDLLLRAFQGIPAGVATLDFFGAGPGTTEGQWEREFRALNRHPGVNFRGRFDNRRIAEVLGGIDVLIVPSRWYENAPLTIHEAVMAKIPFVTSGHGGMTELAERFGNGLLFRPDDADDLARVLRRFVDEPGLIAQLQPKRQVRSVADDVEGLLARFEALARRPAAT